MRPTTQLRNSVQKTWDATTDHPFCKELAYGTLPVEKMCWYLVQDYKFLDQFVRILAAAIMHAPTLADSIPAAQFLGLVTSTENTYFKRSFEALGVSERQQNVPATPATLDFQALMQAAQLSGRYEQMLTVLVVAEWSYLSWADQYKEYNDDLPFWFAEWIDLHSGADFEGFVAYLRMQLDAVWISLDDTQKNAATKLFQEAVRCEKAFFDEAYFAIHS